MERRSPRQKKPLSSSTPTKAVYYAGARFETRPTLSSLPVPPMRWTLSSPSPLLRSQSTPSSPITTNAMGAGEEIRRPATTPVTTVFKSASFPGDSSSLMSLFRVRESSSNAQKLILEPQSPRKEVEGKVDLMQMLIKASPAKKQEQPPQAEVVKEKKVILTPVKVKQVPIANAKPCHLQLNDATGQEYKNVSDCLKSLLKVSA